eukprot:scaffold1804_cov263-Pinguiococcus_pyrenoidosus.AAC.8
MDSSRTFTGDHQAVLLEKTGYRKTKSLIETVATHQACSLPPRQTLAEIGHEANRSLTQRSQPRNVALTPKESRRSRDLILIVTHDRGGCVEGLFSLSLLHTQPPMNRERRTERLPWRQAVRQSYFKLQPKFLRSAGRRLFFPAEVHRAQRLLRCRATVCCATQDALQQTPNQHP